MKNRREISQKKISTRLGPLYLLASSKGLAGVYWERQAASPPEVGSRERQILEQAASQLKEYFAGHRKDFDLPLDAEGTVFQKKVWALLRKIPYGGTKSYKQIAIDLKSKNACRAVGNANGKNPLCIVVPCHRVISSDGSIGGYSGGLHHKKKLLHLENRLK